MSHPAFQWLLSAVGTVGRLLSRGSGTSRHAAAIGRGVQAQTAGDVHGDNIQGTNVTIVHPPPSEPSPAAAADETLARLIEDARAALHLYNITLPLADGLLKCLELAIAVDDRAAQEWLEAELYGYPGPKAAPSDEERDLYTNAYYRFVTTKVSHTYSDRSGYHGAHSTGPKVFCWRAIPHIERVAPRGAELRERYPLCALGEHADEFAQMASEDGDLALTIDSDQGASILSSVRVRATKFVAEQGRRLTGEQG